MDNKQPPEELLDRLLSGELPTEDEIREYLYEARAYALAYLNVDLKAGLLVDKRRVTAFNSLQNAVERHELMHRGKHGDALATLASEWQAALDRAKG
jgi:hypothetical protein